jgi:aspartyl protease family protein
MFSPGWPVLKSSLVPALVMFGLAAAGLVVVRDQINREPMAEAPADSGPVQVASAETTPTRTARLRKESDGHYWTTAKVNGAPVRFLVDSGASVVALTTRDARRIGLDLDALPRSVQVSTANGKVMAATAMLETITIDRVEVQNVRAVVIDDGLDQSLLGMSFLNQLKGWDVTPTAIEVRGK